MFDQFPVSHADCAARSCSADVAGEVPEDGVSVDLSGVLEDGQKADSVDGLLRQINAGGGEHRGIEVHAEDRLVAGSARVVDAGPPDAGGDSDAAFVEGSFAAVQGSHESRCATVI